MFNVHVNACKHSNKTISIIINLHKLKRWLFGFQLAIQTEYFFCSERIIPKKIVSIKDQHATVYPQENQQNFKRQPITLITLKAEVHEI
jgi:hypothetical protein